MVLPCGHFYSVPGINYWLLNHSVRCPICQADVREQLRNLPDENNQTEEDEEYSEHSSDEEDIDHDNEIEVRPPPEEMNLGDLMQQIVGGMQLNLENAQQNSNRPNVDLSNLTSVLVPQFPRIPQASQDAQPPDAQSIPEEDSSLHNEDPD